MAIKSSKPNPNPNSRNDQESTDTVRASFSSNGSKLNKSCFVSQPRIFNPIATAASNPTGYSRRISFGGNDGGDYEHKENEQDINPKPTRLRSPSVVKGSKNFMSPTISAASKINASPRKKVLGERNEAIRISASYSAGKFHFFSTSPSETETYAVHDHENVLTLRPDNCPQTETALVACMTASEFHNDGAENLINDPAINFTDADDDKNEVEPDAVVLSPLKSFKCDEPESPTKESSTNSVDSMLPPYDPKNNYLSPRPRFLHYKPKPRVEAYVNRGIRFEEDFVLENSFGTEGSNDNEETTPSKDSGEVTPQSSPFSEPSQPLPISESCESLQISESCDPHPIKENLESEAATKNKLGYFTFSKLLGFILVLSFAFSLAIHAPSNTSTWNQEWVMPKFFDESHKVANLAREHMEGLCDSLKLKLVQSFGQLSSTTGFSPLKYTNVTDLLEHDYGDYEFTKFKRDTFGVEKGSTELLSDQMEIPGFNGWDYELEQVTTDTSDETVNVESVGDLESEDHIDFSDKYQVAQPDYQGVDELQEKSETSEPENIAVEHVFENSEVVETSEPEDIAVEHVFKHSEVVATEQQRYLIETSEPEDIAVEHVFENSEVVATEQQQYLIETGPEESRQPAQENVDTFLDIADEPQIMIEEEEHLSTFSIEPELLESSTPIAFEHWIAKLLEVVVSAKQLLADNNTVATSIISVVILLLATILVYFKIRDRFSQQEVEELKPLSKSIAACNIKPQISCSQSGSVPEEFEKMEGESCPSEMSSSQSVEKSTCSSKRGNRGAVEVKSYERNSVRRNHKSESLASASSYGSFTAYSIVHSKNGDEEAVTPLRRSSRIRNKVTYSS